MSTYLLRFKHYWLEILKQFLDSKTSFDCSTAIPSDSVLNEVRFYARDGHKCLLFMEKSLFFLFLNGYTSVDLTKIWTDQTDSTLCRCLMISILNTLFRKRL